jgi:hypothetical protein
MDQIGPFYSNQPLVQTQLVVGHDNQVKWNVGVSHFETAAALFKLTVSHMWSIFLKTMEHTGQRRKSWDLLPSLYTLANVS